MKLLPKHICAHPDGYLVRVVRGGVLFQAFIAKSNAAPLERAIALRDRFLRLAAEVKIPARKAYSNTGVVGVSETVKWRAWRSYPCFCVSWSRNGKGHTKRFMYGRGKPRSQALSEAIKHRRKMSEAAHA